MPVRARSRPRTGPGSVPRCSSALGADLEPERRPPARAIPALSCGQRCEGRAALARTATPRGSPGRWTLRAIEPSTVAGATVAPAPMPEERVRARGLHAFASVAGACLVVRMHRLVVVTALLASQTEPLPTKLELQGIVGYSSSPSSSALASLRSGISKPSVNLP